MSQSDKTTLSPGPENLHIDSSRLFPSPEQLWKPHLEEGKPGSPHHFTTQEHLTFLLYRNKLLPDPAWALTVYQLQQLA